MIQNVSQILIKAKSIVFYLSEFCGGWDALCEYGKSDYFGPSFKRLFGNILGILKPFLSNLNEKFLIHLRNLCEQSSQWNSSDFVNAINRECFLLIGNEKCVLDFSTSLRKEVGAVVFEISCAEDLNPLKKAAFLRICEEISFFLGYYNIISKFFKEVKLENERNICLESFGNSSIMEV